MTIAVPSDGWAWITGASQGLGRALALRLVESGWRVAASARSDDELRDLAEAVEKSGAPGRIWPLPVDVTDAAANRHAVARIERSGGLALAVLNAGTHQAMPAQELSLDGFEKLVSLNVLGTVKGLIPAVEAMRQRGSGQIAVVASVAGYLGLPTASAYGLTKAGLINMCEALHVELARQGITLQVVNPGFVETPLTDRNDFPMPFLMSVEKAAAAFEKGLGKGRFEIAFPRRFVAIMKGLRALPYPLAFAITRRMIRKEEPHS